MAPFGNISNPFTKRRREREEQQRKAQIEQLRLQQQLYTAVQLQVQQSRLQERAAPAPATVAQCLAACQGQLHQLRELPPSSLAHAFPAVNIAVRLAYDLVFTLDTHAHYAVQQLKDALKEMGPDEQQLWLLQVAELEEEVQIQTERIVLAASPNASPAAAKGQTRISAGPRPGGVAAAAAAAAAASSVQHAFHRAASKAAELPGAGLKKAVQQLPTSVPWQDRLRAGSTGMQHSKQQEQQLPTPPCDQAQEQGVGEVPRASIDMFRGLEVVKLQGKARAYRPEQGHQNANQTDSKEAGSTAQNSSASEVDRCSPGVVSREQDPTSPSSAKAAASAGPSSGSCRPANLSIRRGNVSRGPSLSSFEPKSPDQAVGHQDSYLSSHGSHSSTGDKHGWQARSKSNPSWSADMTAAAAASYAAHAGITPEELTVAKVIKKKTRGIKVGHGLTAEEPEPALSSVIPGHPVLETCQQQPPLQQQEITPVEVEHQQQQAHMEALLAQRYSYLQAQQRAQQLRQQEAEQHQAAHQQQNGLREHHVEGPLGASSSATASPAATLASPPLLHHSDTARTLAAARTLDALEAGASDTVKLTPPVSQPPSARSLQASMPPFQLSSLDPIKDLDDYLINLSGPITACQQAAIQAAAQLVQQLAQVQQQLHVQKLSIASRMQDAVASLSDAQSSVTALEAEQSRLAEAEEFERAAAVNTLLQTKAMQRDELQQQLSQLEEAAGKLAQQRTRLVSCQADACGLAAAYLQKLRSSQVQLLEHLIAQAQQEAAATAQSHADMAQTIDKARSLLAQRKVQVASAMEEADTRNQAASAPLQLAKTHAAARCQAIQSEIDSLKAQLLEKEAALVAANNSLADADKQLQAATAQCSIAQEQLKAHQSNLSSQEQQLEAQAQAVQAAKLSAAQQLAAAEAQHSTLAAQGHALDSAAAEMARCKARIAARVEMESRVGAVREELRAKQQAAQDKLQALISRIAACDSQAAGLASQLAEHRSQQAAARAQLAVVEQSLPAVQAAKKSAVAKKDYKKAAGLDLECRALASQAECLQATLAELGDTVDKAQLSVTNLESEALSLRASESEHRQAAAAARFAFLTGSIQLQRAQLQRLQTSQPAASQPGSESDDSPSAAQLVGVEGLDACEAEQLQADIRVAVMEARHLQQEWGFGASDRASLPADLLAALSGAPGSRVTAPLSCEQSQEQQPQAHAQAQARSQPHAPPAPSPTPPQQQASEVGMAPLPQGDGGKQHSLSTLSQATSSAGFVQNGMSDSSCQAPHTHIKAAALETLDGSSEADEAEAVAADKQQVLLLPSASQSSLVSSCSQGRLDGPAAAAGSWASPAARHSAVGHTTQASKEEGTSTLMRGCELDVVNAPHSNGTAHPAAAASALTTSGSGRSSLDGRPMLDTAGSLDNPSLAAPPSLSLATAAPSNTQSSSSSLEKQSDRPPAHLHTSSHPTSGTPAEPTQPASGAPGSELGGAKVWGTPDHHGVQGDTHHEGEEATPRAARPPGWGAAPGQAVAATFQGKQDVGEHAGDMIRTAMQH
ncbi:hypothetical protein QJQ45_016080 [Haematococcus lacustris]|nr:hypothetical protein QJQ45_016080 [Haematococcus lacustris]